MYRSRAGGHFYGKENEIWIGFEPEILPEHDQYNVDILIPGYAERKCSEDGFWLAEDGEEAMDPSW